MNNIYFHNQDTLKKIVIKYLLGLIPLIIYGFYKNGILLYLDNLISFTNLFTIFYLLIIGIVLLLIVNYIFKKDTFWNMDLILVIIVSMFMPSRINLIIYTIFLFLSLIIINLISKKIKYNKISLVVLLILLGLILLNKLNYMNLAEEMEIYALNFFDLICGRSVGGIATSNIVLGIICLFYFAFFNNYKKIIAFSSLVAFVICTLIIKNFDIYAILTSNAILALILIAPESINTPINLKQMVIYGIGLGILVSIFTNFVSMQIGCFLAIFIWSILMPVLVNLLEK